MMNNTPFFNNNRQQPNFMQFVQSMRQQNIDPQAKVQELLNSGQMTQEQFNQFRMIANQLTGKNM